ncbi:MAG: acyl-CoA dehydrogenase family protein [Gemmatimonadetes bacterium]|nr:acyl-CoA dehydrogenase family protein [Gemmatimonadota bacterium]
MLASERREVREAAREFAEGEIAPCAAAWDRERAFDRRVLDRLAELGFLGMCVPEEYGGLGFDLETYVAVLEEIARADLAVALTVAVQNGPVSHLILAHGTRAQRTNWLPMLASGERIAAFALAEADAGSDPGALLTRAERTHEGAWRLDGSKRWVTNGSLADVAVVFAGTSPPGEGPGVGAFLVDTDAKGYRVAGREKTMGLRASETVAVELAGVRVGEDRLVGDAGSGLGYALEAVDVGRLGVAAQAVGVAQAALEHAVRYSRERRQFGRRIADFGAIRSKLATMATKVAASRALVAGVAAALGQSGTPTRDGLTAAASSAMAKLSASETAMWVTEEAVRIFGGYGFMREFPVEKLMRDAKGTEILGGTSEIMRLVVGRALTGVA